MHVHSCWLSSLLFITLVTAHAVSPINNHPPADLKDRSLSTGTGVSLLRTITPPYPTGSANGTSVPTSSVYSTSSIHPSGVSSTSTGGPGPTPTSFYLIAADTGTYLDGDYLYIGIDDSGDQLFHLLFEQRFPAGPSSFSLSANGTLVQDQTGRIARYRKVQENEEDAVYQDLLFFVDPDAPEDPDDRAVTCEIVHGALTCQSGANGVFYKPPQYVTEYELTLASVTLGQVVLPGSYQITLLVADSFD